MEKLPICRICLVQNVRMYIVVNRNLHKLYEKLTDIPFVTKDRRPILACFVCFSKLKQSYQLLRKCLDSEVQLVEMMNKDYEPNLLKDEDSLDLYCGFVKSPIMHISIVDECQTESNNITSKQELPAVCEGLDEFIEPLGEHQSDELETENLHQSYLVEENKPIKYYESDSDDDIPLMEFKTEVVEEEVCKRKQEASETKLSISQSACTAGDVVRMSRVIVDKLSLVAGCRPSTALDWLRLLRAMLALHAQHCAIILPPSCQEEELVQLLEIVCCDAACVNIRTSELALVILYYKLEQQLAESLAAAEESGAIPEHAYYLYDFARQLQLHCHMCESSLAQARARVRHVLSRYERCEARRDQRQRLVWRLSERTLKVLRPTDRLTSLLPTIEEQHFAVDATPTRTRSGSESSENEETSDWPRSPVLPVYCDN